MAGVNDEGNNYKLQTITVLQNADRADDRNWSRQTNLAKAQILATLHLADQVEAVTNKLDLILLEITARRGV